MIDIDQQGFANSHKKWFFLVEATTFKIGHWISPLRLWLETTTLGGTELLLLRGTPLPVAEGAYTDKTHRQRQTQYHSTICVPIACRWLWALGRQWILLRIDWLHKQIVNETVTLRCACVLAGQLLQNLAQAHFSFSAANVTDNRVVVRYVVIALYWHSIAVCMGDCRQVRLWSEAGCSNALIDVRCH